MNSLKKRAYLTNIGLYLEELRILTRERVAKSDVISIEEVETIRRDSSGLRKMPFSKVEINFAEKESERFKVYIERLCRANDSGVYIWTEKSNHCGLYRAKGLKYVYWGFPFDINDEGVLAFLCDDLQDELLLDFETDPSGKVTLSVECQGSSWPEIKY